MSTKIRFGITGSGFMTPHKPTVETMAYRWRAIAGNLSRLARGEPLLRIVRP